MVPFVVTLLLTDTAASVVRTHSLPGTRQRYVAATILRVTQYPTLAVVALSFVVAVSLHAWPQAVIFATCTVVVMLDIIWRRRDDDDDWFKGAGKRMRRWVTNRLRALTPVPAGAGA